MGHLTPPHPPQNWGHCQGGTAIRGHQGPFLRIERTTGGNPPCTGSDRGGRRWVRTKTSSSRTIHGCLALILSLNRPDEAPPNEVKGNSELNGRIIPSTSLNKNVFKKQTLKQQLYVTYPIYTQSKNRAGTLVVCIVCMFYLYINIVPLCCTTISFLFVSTLVLAVAFLC